MTVGLSVVIPCFNEEPRLRSTLETILSYLEQRDRVFEVIVVDDGSTDRTVEIAQSYSSRHVRALRLGRHLGKGAALKSGVAESQGEWILLTDADLSTPIRELEELEEHAGDLDLVVGSRAAKGSRITRHQPFYRELMGKTFNLLIRLLGVSGFRDTQCGFKLLRGAPGRALFSALTIDRFAYDVELLILARERGYRVREVGVEWAHVEKSRVNPVIDSWHMFLDVARLRWRHRRRGR